MKICVLLVIWGISATYAFEKKITESGVTRKGRGIRVGSPTLPHLHAHGNDVTFADRPIVRTLPILGEGPAEDPAVYPSISATAPFIAPVPIPAIAPAIFPTIIPGSGIDSAIAHAPISAVGPVSPGTLPLGSFTAGYPLSGNANIGSGLILGAPGGPLVGSTHIDLGSIIQHHVHITNRVGIPVEQPYPVPVERRIPISVPHPVEVPIDRPYPVHVPVRIPVKIINNIPIPVEKPVPVPVKVPVKVPVPVPFNILHPHPVAVPVEQGIPIPVPDPVIVRRPIPVAIHVHLEPLDLHNLHHHH